MLLFVFFFLRSVPWSFELHGWKSMRPHPITLGKNKGEKVFEFGKKISVIIEQIKYTKYPMGEE